MEEWRSVIDYEGLYEVSDLGRVRSLGFDKYHPGRIFKPDKIHGYYRVKLCKDVKKKMFFVHRLVYEAFDSKIPEGMVIDHLDGCRTNNNISNLRCCTPKENVNNPVTRPRHVEAMRNKSPEWRKNVRKANNKSVVQIDKQTGEIIKRWECIMDAERQLGICQSSISLCCTGKRKSAGNYRWMFVS